MADVQFTSRPRTQAQLFTWLRRRLFANSLHVLMQRSRLRLAVIVALSLIIWGGLYALFANGFSFLRNLETAVPVSGRVIELLFGMFFLALTGLMVFSTGLLLYGSLFRAPDASFLLSTPAGPDHIFGYKLGEALFFSGWAFMLLGTPLMVSYGIEMEASWPYYVLFLPFLLGFLLLPGAVGAWLSLLIVTYLPQRRKQVLYLLILVLCAAAVWWIASVAEGAERNTVSEAWLRKLLDHLKPAQVPFLPSRWMTRGLMAGANNDVGEAMFYLGLVWSNGLFWYLVGAWTARRVYRRAYNRIASYGGTTQSTKLSPVERVLRACGQSFGHAMDRVLNFSLAWTDRRTRLFVLKDLRTFRRDPIQWVQVVILGGILLLYFIAIPRLPHGQYALYQRTLIGLLNVGVIGLMLATYTSRFVFPMMSLEGRNFWILGLLPLERDSLLKCKFAYAATVTTISSLILAFISEWMLNLPLIVMGVHLLAMLGLSLGLSGISVGLGAVLVNLKESNPSKIATGFGGTINLLVSLMFAILTILLAGVPTFLYFADPQWKDVDEIAVDPIRLWLGISVAALVVVGAAAVFVPLRLGIRAFRKMEF